MVSFSRLRARPNNGAKRTAQVTPDVGTYKLGALLGKGVYGKVKRAEDVKTGRSVAMKIVPLGKMDEKALQTEVELQSRLDHPHVVKVHECIKDLRNTYIPMELAAGGDLLEYLMRHVRLNEKEARRLFQQLIAGLEHCHSKGVCHRDLKPENIMLDEHANVKIADFGLSAEMKDGEFLTDSCGSPTYAAPELLSRGCRYKGPEIDVWSSGCILYALLCNSLPFDADNMPELFAKIKRGVYTVPGYVSADAKDLLSKMLNINAAERITLAEIREHVWFSTNLPAELMKLAQLPEVAAAQGEPDVEDPGKNLVRGNALALANTSQITASQKTPTIKLADAILQKRTASSIFRMFTKGGRQLRFFGLPPPCSRAVIALA